MLSVAGLLPLCLGWPAAYAACREAAVRGLLPASRRISLACAAVLWASLLTLAVETLGLFRALGPAGLGLAWLGIDVLLAGLAIAGARRRGAGRPLAFAEEAAALRSAWARLSRAARAAWAFGIVLSLLLFAAAAVSGTGNEDAHAYHLSRVMHWLQQGSVDHFPTSNPRETEMGPWSGFVVLHCFAFGTGDRLAHLPQWMSMLLCALLASRLAEDLWRRCLAGGAGEDVPAGREAGAAAALFLLTVPIGMMEAMSPQTDWATSLWLLTAVSLGLDLLSGTPSAPRLAALGLALGLGWLTKGTFALYAAPFLLAWIPGLVRARFSAGRILAGASLMLLCAAALTLPHALRNRRDFGSPLGSSATMAMVRNEHVSRGVVSSNLSRNLLLHADLGLPFVTRAMVGALEAYHEWMRIDIDDPGTTLLAEPLRFPEGLQVDDGLAPAPFHVAWGALALGGAAVRRRRFARLWGYLGAVLAGLLLFAALLKFQIYHSRLHLPFFALLAPAVALIFRSVVPRGLWPSGLALALFALVCLGVNRARPLLDPAYRSLPREEQYLYRRGPEWTPFHRDWTQALRKIAEELAAAGPPRVGVLNLGYHWPEYPLWAMLRNRGFRGALEHAEVPKDVLDSRVFVAYDGRVPPALAASHPRVSRHPPLMILWPESPSGR